MGEWGEVVGFGSVVPSGDNGALRSAVRAKRLPDMFDAYRRAPAVVVVLHLRCKIKVAEPLPEVPIAQSAVQVNK